MARNWPAGDDAGFLVERSDSIVGSEVATSVASMPGYVVKPLNSETWPDFARLVERHNRVLPR